MKASELKLGDRFYCGVKEWKHCGWYSAVNHIAAEEVETKERRIISCHEPVVKKGVRNDIQTISSTSVPRGEE